MCFIVCVTLDDIEWNFVCTSDTIHFNYSLFNKYCMLLVMICSCCFFSSISYEKNVRTSSATLYLRLYMHFHYYRMYPQPHKYALCAIRIHLFFFVSFSLPLSVYASLLFVRRCRPALHTHTHARSLFFLYALPLWVDNLHVQVDNKFAMASDVCAVHETYYYECGIFFLLAWMCLCLVGNLWCGKKKDGDSRRIDVWIDWAVLIWVWMMTIGNCEISQGKWWISTEFYWLGGRNVRIIIYFIFQAIVVDISSPMLLMLVFQ